MDDRLGNRLSVKQPNINYDGPTYEPETVSDQSSKLSWKKTVGKSGETHKVDATHTSQQKKN